MKNKFMVFKLRELLKNLLLAIIGIVIIVFIISFFTDDNDKNEISYVPGTYTSSILVDDNLINIEVALSENKIEDISLKHLSEATPVFYPLFEDVGEDLFSEIKKKQDLNVDIKEGTEVTSELLIDGVKTCLEKAKK